MKRYKKISWVFVIVCAAIAMFQVYWLLNSYNSQKELIERKINIAFKEAVQEIEIAVVKKDIAFTTNLLTGFIPQFKSQYDIDASIVDPSKTVNDYINTKTIDSVFAKKIYKTDANAHIQYTILAQNTGSVDTVCSKCYCTDKLTTLQGKSVQYFVQVKNLESIVLDKMKNQIAVAALVLLIIICGGIYTYKMIVAQKQLITYKNDFVTTITHELKTPISSVALAIEAITKFNAYDDKALTYKYLDASSDELKRLNSLVDRVLKLSAFEHSKIELQTDEFNLQEIAQDVINTMQPYFNKVNATVSLQAGNLTNSIIADAVHIKSVLYNLLDNAVKYSKDNAIVKVVVEENEQCFMISVADNGMGIDEKYQHRIFEKFYRIPQAGKNILGYGLGLSYVKHVVALHQGTISVNSTLHAGSKFIITIPKSIS